MRFGVQLSMKPPAEQSTTSTPIAFNSRASTTVSSSDQPLSTPSMVDVRKKSGLSAGHASRTARATSSAMRMRPARSPP